MEYAGMPERSNGRRSGRRSLVLAEVQILLPAFRIEDAAIRRIRGCRVLRDLAGGLHNPPPRILRL